MKIGIDARLWNESGVGRYTRNLVTNLQVLDKNNEYILFVLNKDYQNLKSQISNLKNWKLSIADIRWHTLEEQFKFPAILNKENLDLTHFPYFSVPLFYNKPFVVTIHDLIISHFPTGEASTLPLPLYGLKLAGYKFIINSAAKRAKKIITVSNTTKEDIVKTLHIKEDRIVVTYEGIESISGQNPRIKFSNYFLYVGNAYPHKNLKRLVDAFKIVRQEHKNISLLLVGKEDYFYRKLKEYVKIYNLERSVLFSGYIPDSELTYLYQNAKALIVPSLMEGFGLPGLEAFSNKCIVLASEIPVFKELYKDGAIYFNPLEINSIKNAMDKTFKSKLKENSDRGIELVKNFSWEKMAKETLKIYESCLGLRPG